MIVGGRWPTISYVKSLAKRTLTPGAVIPFKNPIALLSLHSSIDLSRQTSAQSRSRFTWPTRLSRGRYPFDRSKPLDLKRSGEKPSDFPLPLFGHSIKHLAVAAAASSSLPDSSIANSLSYLLSRSNALSPPTYRILLQLFCQSPRDCFFFFMADSVDPIKRAIKRLYRLLFFPFFFFLRVSHFNEPLLLQNVRERYFHVRFTTLEKGVTKDSRV